MMHLKFPLPAGYFPKFELTPDESLAYKELVSDLVKDTRRDYDAYVRDGARKVDTRTWKLAKSKDRLHIFKRRSEYGAAPIGLTGHHNSTTSSGYGSSIDHGLRSGSESSSSGFVSPASLRHAPSLRSKDGGSSRGRVLSSSSRGSANGGSTDPTLTVLDESTASGVHRRLLEPTMLATGVIEGTVDDIVFAMHEASADETKASAAVVGDDSLIDTVVLHTIKASKATYLGLKWKLSRTPGGNRDMCFIEYVGVANDAKGQRYGFKVLESIKLRHCPAFADNSIIRTDISFCYLFRESGTPGIVDVYMQGAFDSSGDAVTAGGVGDSRSTIDMLLEVERCMEIAESKKLLDLVAKQAAAPPRPKQNGSQCSICRAKPGLLSSHLLCQGCGAVICTKCRMKKVVVSFKKGSPNKQKVSCCKICLVNVKEKSPFEGEQIPTAQPTLKAIQKKPSASGMTTPSSASSRSASIDHHTGGGLATTHELALALPQSSGAVAKYDRHRTADSLTDTDYSASMQSWQGSSVSSSYSDLDDSYGAYSPHNQQIVAANGKMPVVAESPAARARYHAQLQQHAYQTPPGSGRGYQTGPPPPGGGANLDQHRLGLYNQMLELQMQAERAYNLANQNAAYIQPQRQHE